MAARGRLQGGKPDRPEVEKRRERRVLLPSNRVAVFEIPNVGEFIDLRSEAIRKAAGRGESNDTAIGIELGAILLRRKLVGLTAEPVTSVLRSGTDLAALRAEIEKENVERAKRGEAPVDVDGAVAAAEDAAEDVEATKESARPLAVNDLVWDEKTNAAGEYLAAARVAYLDTPEGADWQALNDFAALIMPAVMRGLDAPKAQRPRIRSLR